MVKPIKLVDHANSASHTYVLSAVLEELSQENGLYDSASMAHTEKDFEDCFHHVMKHPIGSSGVSGVAKEKKQGR